MRASALVQQVLVDLSPVDTLAATLLPADADPHKFGARLTDTGPAIDYQLRLLIRAAST